MEPLNKISRSAKLGVFLTLVVVGGTFRVLAEDNPDYHAPVPGTYSLPLIKPAGDGEVIDSQNHPLHLRELTHGRVTVMSFIYTRCAATKACPFATGVLRQLHQESQNDPALANGMRLVSMSFDPAGDTPERMAEYSSLAETTRPGAEWRFVTVRSQAQLQPILDAYGQAVNKRSNPNDPQGPLYHILRVFLIDANGNVRNIYSSDTLDPRLVLADVKTLLSGGSGSQSKAPPASP
jgi:cytochrome oxidase Cu insertion factor (SCO1/SenC/PrrC family)